MKKSKIIMGLVITLMLPLLVSCGSESSEIDKISSENTEQKEKDAKEKKEEEEKKKQEEKDKKEAERKKKEEKYEKDSLKSATESYEKRKKEVAKDVPVYAKAAFEAKAPMVSFIPESSYEDLPEFVSAFQPEGYKYHSVERWKASDSNRTGAEYYMLFYEYVGDEATSDSDK